MSSNRRHKESNMTFVIDNENIITAYGRSQEADGEQGESFSSEQELTDLAANWPAARLVEVWNGIPGLTPIKKFTTASPPSRGSELAKAAGCILSKIN